VKFYTQSFAPYIETGEPLGSRTISKSRAAMLSPASIRNVMADLADEGYLSSLTLPPAACQPKKRFASMSHL